MKLCLENGAGMEVVRVRPRAFGCLCTRLLDSGCPCEVQDN